MSSYVTVNVDVDVDLNEIDTKDLLEELKLRGQFLSDQSINDAMEMFNAFKLRNIDKAMELAKKIACDNTGGIL